MRFARRSAALPAVVLALLGSAVAQPPPPPLNSLWVQGGGAVGETAEIGVASHLAGLTDYVVAFSHAVCPAPQTPQLAPPLFVLAAGRLPGSLSTLLRVPVPAAPPLVGLPVHLQAGFGDGNSWTASKVCTWLLAPDVQRRFTLVTATRTFPMQPGDGPARVTLVDGTVLLSGGREQSLPGWRFKNTAYVYDPIRSTSTLVWNMNAPRGGHVMRRLADGTVLVVGGDQDDQSPTAELYDPKTLRFQSLGAVPYFLEDPAAVLIKEPGTGKEFVLIAGGLALRNSLPTLRAMLYDATSRVFTTLPGMTRPRAQAAAVAMAGGSVLITGGHDSLLKTGADAELFLLATRRFYPWGAMTAPRHGHAMVALDPFRALILAGSDGTASRRDMELFDGLAQRSWPLPLRLHLGRLGFDPVWLADGSLLVAGGEQGAPADPGRTPEILSAGGVTLLRPIGAMQPEIAVQPLPGGGAMAFGYSTVHHLK